MSDGDELTRSQIEHLGDRLRNGPASADDIARLDHFKSAVMFRTNAFADRVAEIAAQNSYAFSKRLQKTNPSIIDKLRRTSVELSRMQDIAACRVLVPTMKDLVDNAWGEITAEFQDVRIIDRLALPQNGYRAVHFIVRDGFHSFEIQLRTELQHAWATLSEKLADRFGQGLKYGLGPEAQRTFLADLSIEIAEIEASEADDVMGYVASDEGEADPLALEGSPGRRRRKLSLMQRIAEMRRFL